jgi:predicted dithiol-disulfide oxidoreductase (DUF899 family)
MTSIRELQSPEYRKLRGELLEAERALVEQRERVAELRRALPSGAVVQQDYVFDEGPADPSRNAEGDFFQTPLSELFTGGKDELLIQHMMYSPDSERACPMCSMWIDGIDGVARHLNDRINFAVVARAPIARLRGWGATRGWRHVRLLSSHGNRFNADLGVELTADRQLPAFSVFVREADGRIRHTYTSEGSLEERHHRALDLLSPIWNLYDLMPSGRGDWFPKHFYDE